MDLPDWLVPSQSPSTTPLDQPSPTNSAGVPLWLVGHHVDEPTPPPSSIQRALTIRECEAAFHYVLEQMYAGKSLKQALREHPANIDPGVFTHWLHKDPKRSALFREAKVIRSEAWTGRMVELAEDTTDTPIDLDRAKVAIDVYKWLISRENRKEYGDTKTIEMNTTISITAALEQANSRLIEATVIEDEDDNLALPPGQADDDE